MTTESLSHIGWSSSTSNTMFSQIGQFTFNDLKSIKLNNRSTVRIADFRVSLNLNSNRESLVLFVEIIHASSDIVKSIDTFPSILFMFFLIVFSDSLVFVDWVLFIDLHQNAVFVVTSSDIWTFVFIMTGHSISFGSDRFESIELCSNEGRRFELVNID